MGVGRGHEHGFSLVELVVVTLVIGILASITLPQFLRQRDVARQSTVEADLRNVAVQLESCRARDGAYPPPHVIADEVCDGVTATLSPQVTIEQTSVSGRLVGRHGGLVGRSVVYDRADGGLQAWTADGG